MADSSDREEAVLETEGVKRDEKGRVRFRALEQSKSGDSREDE